MHFSDSELQILSIIDIIIVYLFCILQISYNVLTAIFIKKSTNIINRWELWRAYLFALAPIIYSLLPILLVLFLYIPSSGEISNNNFPGLDFALLLIYVHLPPIIIVFTVIIVWNIICSVKNKQNIGFNNLIKQECCFNQELIDEWDLKTKVIFRKAIYKWYKKQIKLIEQTNDQNGLLKILANVQGWYIAKQRFQFFWYLGNKYNWIKNYYKTHYDSLIYKIKERYIEVK